MGRLFYGKKACFFTIGVEKVENSVEMLKSAVENKFWSKYTNAGNTADKNFRGTHNIYEKTFLSEEIIRTQ